MDLTTLEHSPLGGSGAARWLACGGSFLLHKEQLIDGTHERIESQFASLGTDAHELASTCLQEGTEPWEYIGDVFGKNTVGSGAEDIDPESVAIYVNDCRAIMDKLGKPAEACIIEGYFEHPDIHPLLKGQVDFGAWSPKHGVAYLRDFKNGEGVGVQAYDNKQLRYYGFLMLLEFPWLKAAPDDFVFNLGICQPNYYGKFEDTDQWETTVKDIREWGHDVLIPRMWQLDRAQDVDLADFATGDHCQFCPVALDCPLLQEAYMKFAYGSEFVEMLTNEELSEYYRHKEAAQRFKTALEKTVQHRLVTGEQIEGVKLVEKRTNRVWKGSAKAALIKTLGEAAYKPKELKSPAQVEKLSSLGAALSKEHGYKPDASGFATAPANDPRPEAKGRSAQVFEQFQGDTAAEGW